MQVLGLLAKCHARGIALRRVRPSQLRVTAAGAVFADTLPAPPSEIALYAAPEELGLTGPAQNWSSAAAAPTSPALAQLAISGSLAGGSGGSAVTPPQTAVGAATLSAMAADMFSLGILFFELFHPIPGGAAERARTLGELRHRILPMDLLQVCFTSHAASLAQRPTRQSFLFNVMLRQDMLISRWDLPSEVNKSCSRHLEWCCTLCLA